MIDKDREEFNYKLEMLFDEYHYSIYLIDDIWEMKDKIKAEIAKCPTYTSPDMLFNDLSLFL